MAKHWPFSKPSGAVLGLRVERLDSAFKRLDSQHTLTHQAYRFRFVLEQPAQLLITVSSRIANAKGWHRAGYLAHILRGAPIPAPVADVERLYMGQQYIAIPWSGLGYYLEFWPHTWIADYRIELWAREAVAPQTAAPIQNQNSLLLFRTSTGSPEPFTFFGVPINFP
mgnify:CR=1 FL=1